MCKSSFKNGQESSWSRTGPKAYITLPQIDYCLWEPGPLWGEEFGDWQTRAHKSSNTHKLSGRYLQYSDEWVRMASPQWHWPYHWGNKGACVHVYVCVRECVCPSFPPHRIHLKILRLFYWWKLLPFILTVSASGGKYEYEGERRRREKERAGMMWVGVQINACFVTAYVYRGIWQHKLAERSFYHPFTGKTKKKTPPCKTISNSEPSCLVSQAVDPLLIKGCMRWGTHMGMCYFLCRRRISKTYFFSLKHSIGCLFAGKGPGHAAEPQSTEEWDLYLQT